VAFAFTCVGVVEKVAVIVLVGIFVVIVREPDPVSPVWMAARLIELKMLTGGVGSWYWIVEV
jgi:hypothetical protein